MKHKYNFFFLFLLISLSALAQEKKLPQGWDEILLEGKKAYMNLVTGDVVTIKPTKPALKPKKVKEYDPTITHVVKKGETLSIIARKHNLNLAQLYRLNSLEDFDTIEVGDEIVVGYKNDKVKSFEENKTTSNNTYTVKNGDTLFSIARNNNVSVKTIKELNNLKSNTIKVGDKLKIR